MTKSVLINLNTGAVEEVSSKAPAFTPSPWLIHAKHRWVVPAEDAFKEPDDALPICQLRDPDARLTEDETLANGFLIAAAPELYADNYLAAEGMEETASAIENVFPLHAAGLRETAKRLRATAAKARGEQS